MVPESLENVQKTSWNVMENLPLPFLRDRWFRHHRRLYPVRRPQFGSSAQPQTNRTLCISYYGAVYVFIIYSCIHSFSQQYGYMNLFEAYANLKKVLKRSCLDALEDIMDELVMSFLIATVTAWLHYI